MNQRNFKIDGRAIRLVRLDNFYESSNDSKAQKFFGQMLNWKIQGYKCRYESTFIPVDQSDFFNRHYIFCFETENGELLPFSGQRYISLNRCSHYKSTFPLHTTVSHSRCPVNIEFLNEKIASHEKRGIDLIYPSGYTMNKELSGKHQFSSFGAESTGAIHYFERKLSPESNFITASVMRFKTYRLLRLVGHRFGVHNGEELPSFSKKQAGNEELKLMYLEQLSQWAESCYEKLMPLFEEAVVIKAESSEKDRAAA